ncbi:MAG: hypothetical protein FD123_498 [Bacteroidetes bacterium]|nr:MAG: hypothetical protein FD123_498 [Bacteroidota bacterium]
MRKITRKGEVEDAVHSALEAFRKNGNASLVRRLDESLFQNRVRFPLLESAAVLLYEAIPEKKQTEIIRAIADTAQIGAFPVAGKWLQLRLGEHYKACFSQAAEIIRQGDEWYVCDIIGERVFGYALLTKPVQTLKELEKLGRHENHWMVRVVGVAGHYAIKKGLPKNKVEELFQLLLALSETTDLHTKKGIGWAAKTTAKFYPGIIQRYADEIENNPAIRPWFKTKIRIGLSRSFKYAGRFQ